MNGGGDSGTRLKVIFNSFFGFFDFVKLYWAKSKRIQTNKENISAKEMGTNGTLRPMRSAYPRKYKDLKYIYNIFKNKIKSSCSKRKNRIVQNCRITVEKSKSI